MHNYSLHHRGARLLSFFSGAGASSPSASAASFALAAASNACFLWQTVARSAAIKLECSLLCCNLSQAIECFLASFGGYMTCSKLLGCPFKCLLLPAPGSLACFVLLRLLLLHRGHPGTERSFGNSSKQFGPVRPRSVPQLAWLWCQACHAVVSMTPGDKWWWDATDRRHSSLQASASDLTAAASSCRA